MVAGHILTRLFIDEVDVGISLHTWEQQEGGATVDQDPSVLAI